MSNIQVIFFLVARGAELKVSGLASNANTLR